MYPPPASEGQPGQEEGGGKGGYQEGLARAEEGRVGVTGGAANRLEGAQDGAQGQGNLRT